MSATTVLRGIAWNHSRAVPPLVATAQRFEELHPGVEIHWEKRSLNDFGYAGVIPLAERYDLLVIDHPMMGVARESKCLVDLAPALDDSFLKELASDSAGPSYESYLYDGSLYALPIDAAAPAASFRPDLLKQAGVNQPRTWRDVLDLARKGCVVMPGIPGDVFLNFVALCVSRGGSVPTNSEEFVDVQMGERGLEELRELAGYLPAEIYEWNPIAVYEHLATSDRYAYCPFAYTYSNYSRNGFGSHLILFANPVLLNGGRPLRTVLGGAGLAISARCAARDVALEYSAQVVSAEWQRTLYGLSGGQPGRRSAWQDETLNRITNGFFERTFESIERAYLRPRYPGYIEFQVGAGIPVVQYLQAGGKRAAVVETINELYRQSLERRREQSV